MNTTAIICTFNRSASLARTLGSLAEASPPSDGTWELVVVDNNSSDDTRSVIETFRGRCGFPVRYVLEKEPGLSRARNRGIAEAAGEVLAFTDDDVLVDRHWPRRIAEAFERYDAAAVGGRILPLWEVPPPAWLTEGLYPYLALADYGSRPTYLNSPRVWGANLAFRASVFRDYGGFDTGLGRVPGKLYSGEETDLLRRLLQRGEKILYYPAAEVRHFIPGNRLTKAYFRRWRYDQGALEGIQRERSGGRRTVEALRSFARMLVREIPGYSWHSLFDARRGFASELQIFNTLGLISGLLGAGLYDRGRSSPVIPPGRA